MPPGTKIFDIGWTLGHLDQIWTRILQHLSLIVVPIVAGIVISLILAVWAVRRPRAYGPVTAITGLLYTIPSLAAFAILRPITGLSFITAWIPLTTYTLLILFRNFSAGFTSVPADILEAAEGMGYTRRQRLLRVELPLAVPLMIAGVRLATVTTIGLATIVAVLGDQFGGLGQLITEGIQTFFPTKYLLGAVLSVGLAVGADVLLVRLERAITPWAQARARPQAG
ncbi:MAG TPA: ABC transporter permease [Candidatus Limnocylindrales bacterium]|jgi:osmoprotectant transport system permease protein